jgi:uncharacterized protein YukE
MGTIHMETERLRQSARQLDQWAANMLSSGDSLRSSSGALSVAWQGGGADDYQGKYASLLKTYNSQVQQLQDLALRMSREVDEWESIDGGGVEGWTQLGTARGESVPGSPSSGSTPDPFNWWSWAANAVPGAAGVATGLAEMKISEYGDIGRGLNKLLETPHGGWVDRLEDTGRLITKDEVLSSKAFKYTAESLALGGSIASGFLEGESWDKAIATGAADYLVSKGIEMAVTKGLTYFVPGAGQVMLAYDGALLLGRLAAGGLELAGLHSESAWLQNAVDVIDIGTYTEKLTDGIYDWVKNSIFH